MNSAMGLWVRADWRRRYRGLILLGLLAGLSFAVVATAFAGARRTASSFDRLRAETRAYDHGVAIDAPGSSATGTDHYDDATIDRIRHLPEIESVGGLVLYVAGLPNADWEFAVYAPEDNVVGHLIETGRILRGRLPSLASTNEVAINEAMVDAAHLDVGSVVTVQTLTPDQRLQWIAGDPHAFDHGALGPELRLHVVGVLRGVGDVVGRPEPSLFATPAFDRQYRGRVAYSSRILVVRRAEGVTASAFHDAVDRVTSDVRLGVFDAAVEDQPGRRTTHTLGVGLAVFALIAAIVSLLVVNQAVSRHVHGAGADHQALFALGLTRAQRIGGAIATVMPSAGAAVLLAVLGSYGASTLMPVGPAHRVEPDPGFRFDTLAAISAAVVVTAAIVVSALVAATLATRRERRARRKPRGVSNVAAALAAAGIGPVPTTGIRLAFDRRSPALPVRSTLIGLGAAIAVVAGAFTFAASLDRLESLPRRWGYGWDLMLDTTAGDADNMLTTLATDSDIDGVSLLQSNFALMRRGDRVDGTLAFGLDAQSGHVGYALLSGTQPVGPDEVVIGPGLARLAHLAVGDVADIESCPCGGHPSDATLTKVRVVGTALFPEDDDGNFNDALGFSTAGFAKHVASADTMRVAISVAPGRDVGRVAENLGTQFPGMVSAYSYPSRPGEVANLAGLRPFPRALVIVAALLSLAALANMLNATYQRRRRELATLRSLGLTKRSTRGCIISQSVCVTGIAAVIGIAAGVILGASVWTAATRGIGVATDANRPIVTLGLCLALALGGAIVLGALAGWRLGQLEVAESLRAE